MPPATVGDVIEDGCTPGWVDLRRTASGVYIVTMTADANPENRWIGPFSEAMMKAFDAVERHLEANPDSPAALLTVSNSAKFFSNGIDPDGKYSKKIGVPRPTKSQQMEQSVLTMPGFVRPMMLPIPTVAAIGGHAFGAGLMFALGHDYRLQSTGRGYMCAIEVEIGVGIPPPEMTLFRHALAPPDFFQTVMAAKRWGAEESLRAGLVVRTSPPAALFTDALQYAESQAKLAAGKWRRRNYMAIKHKAKGQVTEEVMAEVFPGGTFRPFMNEESRKAILTKYPYFAAKMDFVKFAKEATSAPIVPMRPKM